MAESPNASPQNGAGSEFRRSLKLLWDQLRFSDQFGKKVFDEPDCEEVRALVSSLNTMAHELGSRKLVAAISNVRPPLTANSPCEKWWDLTLHDPRMMKSVVVLFCLFSNQNTWQVANWKSNQSGIDEILLKWDSWSISLDFKDSITSPQQSHTFVAINDDEIQILRFLKKQNKNCYQVDIAAGTDLSRRNIGNKLNYLVEAGYVSKKAVGCCITDRGRQYLASLPP